MNFGFDLLSFSAITRPFVSLLNLQSISVLAATAALAILCPHAPGQANEWTWIGGSSTLIQGQYYGTYLGHPGVYGTMGMPAPVNIPGGRGGAASWTGRNGNFWLFGGGGVDANGTSGYLNDLWQFNPSTAEWAWMSGASTIPTSGDGNPGVYGTLGVAAPSNIPPGRTSAASWIDSSGNLWLFGGTGADSTGLHYLILDDLWKFNPVTGQWTWIGGYINQQQHEGTYGTQGVPSAGNFPGSRSGAAAWTDSNGNLWLFGGYGNPASYTGYLNDLWTFNPSTLQWTWVAGSGSANQLGIYGSIGVPAATNTPGSREYPAFWTDRSGNLWLFGGSGFDSAEPSVVGELNDLWEFSPSTLEWTWIGGSNAFGSTAGHAGVYGTEGVAAGGNAPGGRDSAMAWADPGGRLWLFGGHGMDSTGYMGQLNDFWMFSPESQEWTWIDGSSVIRTGHYNCFDNGTVCGQGGAYGTLGLPASTNLPGSRTGFSSWVDASGDLWLFGGGGFDASSESGSLNDLWSYATPSQPPAATPVFTPAAGTYPSAQTVSISDATPDAIIYFTTDGTSPTTGSPVYTGPVTLSSNTTLQAIAVTAGFSTSSNASGAYSIQTAAATFSVPSGTYLTPQTIFLSDSTPGATISYSFDNYHFQIYSGPFKVSSYSEIEVYAQAPGLVESPLNTATYNITMGIQIPASGLIGTIAGNGYNWKDGYYSGDLGPAVYASLGFPTGIAVDSNGNVYIADPDCNVIRMISFNTGYISTVAGDYGIGYLEYAQPGYFGDGGPAASAALNAPQAIAVDSARNLYIADSQNHVIRKVDASTKIITTVAGNGNEGFSGDGGSALAASLDTPTSIAVDGSGNIYIADSQNHRIREVTFPNGAVSPGVINTIAGTGVPGYNGNNLAALSTQILAPSAIAVDASGNVYFADGNFIVRKASYPSGTNNPGTVRTIAGTPGQLGFSGDNGPGTSAKMGYAYGLALDSSGDVVIADTTNNRLRAVIFAPGYSNPGTIVTGAGMNYSAPGSGCGGYNGDNIAPTSAALNCPMGIAMGPAGATYFADSENSRIRAISGPPATLSHNLIEAPTQPLPTPQPAPSPTPAPIVAHPVLGPNPVRPVAVKPRSHLESPHPSH